MCPATKLVTRLPVCVTLQCELDADHKGAHQAGDWYWIAPTL